MKFILYENGQKIGEVSDWTTETNPPVYKTVLGKTILSTPANDGCSFVSPKPIHRKSELTVMAGHKVEYFLQIVTVTNHTMIRAKIISMRNVKSATKD